MKVRAFLMYVFFVIKYGCAPVGIFSNLRQTSASGLKLHIPFEGRQA